MMLSNRNHSLSKLSNAASWTKRLVFDKSPYLPEAEWKKSWTGFWKVDDGNNPWDFKEFVGHSPELEEFATTHTSTSFKTCDSAERGQD